jgi:hypothetical protein
MMDVTDTPDEAVAAVADAIRAANSVRSLTEEEREQRALDMQLWREEQRQRDEIQRAASERKRAAAAEKARREADARQRKASEELRQKQRAERGQREADDRLNRRLRAGELKWAQVELAQRQQMRQALMHQRAQVIAELDQHFNPPPPPEPEIIYVEAEQDTGRLGHSDFDPRLMTQPLRWW